MSKTYTVTITDSEQKAFEYAIEDTTDWVSNAVSNRCRIAIDEIVQLTVKNCLDAGIQIPGTKEEIIDLAYAKRWIKTKAEVRAEQAALSASLG